MPVVAGLCFWVAGIICVYIGIDRFDPSFPWLFATTSVVFIFDDIRINSKATQHVLEWTGRCSYSIYLLQYTAIDIVAPIIYEKLLSGNIGDFVAPIRIGVWLAVIIGSYLLSLFAASAIDSTLLKLVQKGFETASSRLVSQCKMLL